MLIVISSKIEDSINQGDMLMEGIFMSEKEADHYHLFKEHQDGKITLGECSELLQLSYRQTLRWWKRFKEEDKIW